MTKEDARSVWTSIGKMRYLVRADGTMVKEDEATTIGDDSKDGTKTESSWGSASEGTNGASSVSGESMRSRKRLLRKTLNLHQQPGAGGLLTALQGDGKEAVPVAGSAR